MPVDLFPRPSAYLEETEDRVFLSNIRHGFYGSQYWEAAVHARIPADEATEVDSYRTGDKFCTVHKDRITARGYRREGR